MSEAEAQPHFSVAEPFDLELTAVRYLDGVISQEAVAQLNALLADDVDARNRFVDICLQARELREILAPRSALAPGVAQDADFEPGRFEAVLAELAREGYLKAASIEDAAESTPAIRDVSPRRVVRPPIEQTHALSIHLSRRFLAIAATVFLAASLALALSLRGRSSATLTGIAGAKWASADLIELGSTLQTGRLVHLESGAVEIRFASSASVIVQGPAAFRVLGRNEAQLEYGKIVAHVPVPAHGFSVHTASLNVTDLGTEFGLNVTRAGVADVEVFTGTIEVGSSLGGTARPSRLTEGQAATCDVESTEIRPAARGTVAFARNFSQVRVPLLLHGTGVAAQEAGSDPYWQIVSESADPTFVPRPAVAIDTESLDKLGPNDPPRSSWISTDAGAPTVPAGIYVFKTSIDLTGVDPKTANIRLKFWVDDEVRDIRINGKSNKIPTEKLRGSPKTGAPWSIPITEQSGLKAGVNDVEFIVFNDLGRMALRVAWEGTAVPLAAK
jgi:hypothetical protein